MVIPLANQVSVSINARLGVDINSDLTGLAILINHGNTIAHGAKRIGDCHGDALGEGGRVNGADVVVAFDDDRAADFDKNGTCVFALVVLFAEEVELGGWTMRNVLSLVVRWRWDVHLARSDTDVACECAGSESAWSVVVGGGHDPVVWVGGSRDDGQSLVEDVVVVVCVVWIGTIWVDGH